MRDIALINAVVLVAEVGDFTRFSNPRQLMAYFGLVPGERSSAETIRRGGRANTRRGLSSWVRLSWRAAPPYVDFLCGNHTCPSIRAGRAEGRQQLRGAASMPLNVAQKLITAHLVDGSLRSGAPITLKIDQTLTQDATGTLVMLDS